MVTPSRKVLKLDGVELHRKIGERLKGLSKKPGSAVIFLTKGKLEFSTDRLTGKSHRNSPMVKAVLDDLKKAQETVREEALNLAKQMYPEKRIAPPSVGEDKTPTIIAFWSNEGGFPPERSHNHTNVDMIVNFQLYPGADGLRVEPLGLPKGIPLPGDKTVIFGGDLNHQSPTGNRLSIAVFIKFEKD